MALDQSLIQIVVLAFVAGFVLFRLYTTLGKRPERSDPRPQPAQGTLGGDPVRAPFAQAGPVPSAGGDGLMAIVKADPRFDIGQFISGARGAYELIVGAFAKGDLTALKPLLTPKVFDIYSKAITDRQAANGVGPELVRLKSADIADASLESDVARVVVKFEAELAEGAVGVRDAKEKWTFERNVRASDPNWRLARVQAA